LYLSSSISPAALISVGWRTSKQREESKEGKKINYTKLLFVPMAEILIIYHQQALLALPRSHSSSHSSLVRLIYVRSSMLRLAHYCDELSLGNCFAFLASSESFFFVFCSPKSQPIERQPRSAHIKVSTLTQPCDKENRVIGAQLIGCLLADITQKLFSFVC
jgi:hypothetical protein